MSHPFSVLERKEWGTELWKMDGCESFIDKALVLMRRSFVGIPGRYTLLYVHLFLRVKYSLHNVH